jgi:hypothetical protein
MNKLQLHAARPRTAGIFQGRSASHGLLRARHAVSATLLHHDVSVRRSMPLRAQWFRNTVTGALECRWVTESVTEPPMHRAAMPRHPTIRMSRCINGAGIRPPSR